jgi:branched-chain amino acid aminotransferase
MKIKIRKVGPAKARPRPQDEGKLGFGVHFSDHVFQMNYREGAGWCNPRIVPYGPIPLDPAALVLHYGQEVFEGLKAYRRSDGGIQLFRPRDNLHRLNRSARRLCMPEVDVPFTLEALKALLRLDRDWIPRTRGASLYIRPTMIATEGALGVKVSPEYLFYIMTGPVGAYYPGGFNPTKILVEDSYVRAVRGGVGEAKTSGNYAASLLAMEEAHAKGYTQVLWLDAVHRSFVEEVGTSNIFFLLDDDLVTPPLGGSILPGITRDSVIQLARDWWIPVQERQIRIEEVIEAIRAGRLREMFATGTAAVISPVGEVSFKGEIFEVNGGKVGDLSRRLYDELTGIQYGDHPDPHGWVEPVA